MNKLLYLTSSSYSGSTLLTFLLNQHPDLFTIGELEGWDYGDKEYRCSCGATLDECRFFQHVKAAYEKAGLSFSTRNFGTKLRLSDGVHMNRYLTSAIPHLNYTAVEKMRDAVLWSFPALKRRLDSAIRSNAVFIESALEYSDARVFIDATKNPFRLRMLHRAKDFDVSVLYLVRDVRGVVASNVRKKKISVKEAATRWLYDQDNILRILKDFSPYFLLYYEDLCSRPDESLSRLYSYLDVEACPFDGKIREGEHHILGNSMRVGAVNEIRLDERSKTELSEAEISVIEQTARRYLARTHNRELESLISHYLCRV